MYINDYSCFDEELVYYSSDRRKCIGVLSSELVVESRCVLLVEVSDAVCA